MALSRHQKYPITRYKKNKEIVKISWYCYLYEQGLFKKKMNKLSMLNGNPITELQKSTHKTHALESRVKELAFQTRIYFQFTIA